MLQGKCVYIMRKRVKLLPVRVMSAKYTTIIPGILSLIHYNKQITQSRIMDFSRPEIYLKEKKKQLKQYFNYSKYRNTFVFTQVAFCKHCVLSVHMFFLNVWPY